MIILSQKWPKLLYFYVQSQSINIPLNLSNALKVKPDISSTGEAEVNVLGHYRKEVTPYLI